MGGQGHAAFLHTLWLDGEVFGLQGKAARPLRGRAGGN